MLPSYTLQTTDICKFSNGYGSGGDDEQLGKAENEQSCAAKVQQTRPSATGVTFYPISKRCFAEYSITLEIVNVQFYARACSFLGIADIKFSIAK